MARELHTIAVRKYCGSKASIQAWTRDDAPNAAGAKQRRNHGGRKEEDGCGDAHIGATV
jgi:hypothetical protein